MLKFDIQFDEKYSYDKAIKLYDNKEYSTFLYYIRDKIEKCSLSTQSNLYFISGKIYKVWKCYDKALLAFRMAMVTDAMANENSDDGKEETACLIYRELAMLYLELDDISGFREAFLNYTHFGNLTADDNYMISCYNEEIAEEREYSNKLVIADDEFKVKHFMKKAQFMLATGEVAQAVELLEKLAENFPTNLDLLEKLTFFYMAAIDMDKLEKLCQHRMNISSDDVDAIAIYLQIKLDSENFDDTAYYNKMITMPIGSIESLQTVCDVIERKGDIEKCLEIVNKFAIDNDCENAYQILVMQALLNLKMGKKQNAAQLFGKANMLYGILGLGNILPEYLKIDSKEIYAARVDFVPDCMWYVAKDKLLRINTNLKYGNAVSDADLWQTFELLMLTGDEDDVINFLVQYKDIFTLKNVDKICLVINLRNITGIVKAGIIYALLLCGVYKICACGVAEAKIAVFEPIEEMNDFPPCYNKAYMYAFAYGFIYLDEFTADVRESALDLLGAMSDTKRKFQDAYALAGAILCNAYVVMSSSVIEDVARMVESNPKRIKNYIDIIQKQGSFYDLGEDDMLEMYLKRLANEIGSLED